MRPDWMLVVSRRRPQRELANYIFSHLSILGNILCGGCGDTSIRCIRAPVPSRSLTWQVLNLVQLGSHDPVKASQITIPLLARSMMVLAA